MLKLQLFQSVEREIALSLVSPDGIVRPSLEKLMQAAICD
jgi:hypothetical protein